MKTIQALTAALCLALMATGCAVTEMRSVTKTPDSGFLGKDASLLTPGDISKGQVGLRYFNPSTSRRARSASGTSTRQRSGASTPRSSSSPSRSGATIPPR